MVEPITREQAKAQLRVTSSAEDTLIDDAIIDARGWIERYTGLVLTCREVVEALHDFGSPLRAWPIVSIDSIQYLDDAQAEAALDVSAYFAQIARRPARLTARSWPTIYPGSTVTVTMMAGFADPAAIIAFSPLIMRAMRILVAGFFLDRRGGDVFTKAEESAKGLCRDFRRWIV